MKRKKKETLFYTGTVLGCLAAVTIVVTASIFLYSRIEAHREAVSAMAEPQVVTYSEDEVNQMVTQAVAEANEATTLQVSDAILSQIQVGLENGQSVVATLRPLYPDDIVVVSNGAYHFVPIREDLKKNGFLEENLLQLENGELAYMEGEEIVSHKGIDVSRYQGDIDWKKVAADGVEYAFIRVGIRGYGEEGRIVLDDKFKDNIADATAAGIKVGVYFFSQAITEEEAVEEANVVLDAISGYDVTYPIVYDIEKTSTQTGRMNQLTVEERTRVTRAFVDTIKEGGYTPMIYSNMEMWTVLLDMSQFEDIEKWFAYYSPDFYFPYDFSVWQYTDGGTVDGISTEVDLNISFKEW